ncbi:hypothetical protein KI387_040843 [Taxus chinensis]|uniref:C-CAP/cofactor C-like domain-containing protein n=1 Tax=Taxus chinensis TaxID=29808 RepID=A0AA38FAA5_TAXCH|nr:hypothetical protein KI387_040843 [Taxus chinensis]
MAELSRTMEISSNEALSVQKFSGERETGASTQQKKHAEMIKHLADLNNARLQQSQSRKSETLSAPVFESVEAFVKRFSQNKQKIQRTLDEFLEKGDNQEKSLVKSGLEALSAEITDLEKLAAENSYFLPSYEARAARNAIAELNERLDYANSNLLPKKKFSFRNKASKSNPKERDENPNENNKNSINAHEKNNSFAYDAPGVRNKNGIVVVNNLDASRDGDFALSDLVDCKIYLRGRLRAFFIHKLKCCQVFAGPVMGSVLIEEAENCVFMLASHQIRIHQTVNTDFYLRVRSRPIVEYASNVRFAPYALFYRGIDEDLQESDLKDETGMWANVDDFRWLRAVASPNWSILPEDDRLPLLDISDLKAEEKAVP